MHNIQPLNELLSRYFYSVWENDESSLSEILSDDITAEFVDSGRNWSGKQQGIHRLITQVNFLKTTTNSPSVDFQIIDIIEEDVQREFFRVKIEEIFSYNGSTKAYSAVSEVSMNRISKMCYK